METIQESKEYLRSNWENGCKCPSCGQTVRLYKRKLNSGMALFLIGLYKLKMKFRERECFSNKEIMKFMSINTSSLDYSVLKHFGLIKADKTSDKLKRNSGFWKITPDGINFSRGIIKIKSHVFLYNNKIQGFSASDINIKEVLSKKFNYQELMKKV